MNSASSWCLYSVMQIIQKTPVMGQVYISALIFIDIDTNQIDVLTRL